MANLRPDGELSYPAPSTAGRDREKKAKDDSADILAAVWRYRWAVILPAIAGLIIGFIFYVQTPETFQSTTRLMVESDRPPVLDAMTGDLYGGVPAIEIVESQLFSDDVCSRAFFHPEMEESRIQLFGGTPGKRDGRVHEFTGLSQQSLKLESELTDARSGQAFVALLHFKHQNRDLCEAAVKAFSESLQQYFNQRQNDSRKDLVGLIEDATEKLHPKLLTLEDQYRSFRQKNAELSWASDGSAVNPHRQRQLLLVEKLSTLTDELRSAEIELESVESITSGAITDPLLALNIIGQLWDKTFVLPTVQQFRDDLRQGDNQLAQIELDQQLLPLMIDLKKYEAQLGPNHPTVKAIASELATMKNELKRLVREESDRIVELMSEGKRESIDPNERARDAAKAVVFAAQARVKVLQQQISEVANQINDARGKAAELSQVEQENLAKLREIERTRELLDQLEENMARVSLVEDEGGTSVLSLTEPSGAYKVAPILLQCLGLGAFIGLALGTGLALLLEKNANTFRDPDEIADLLGVPVLTHVPFFKGKVKKSNKDEDNPFEELDPYLAVVHTPASIAAEAIRSCRTSIFFELAGDTGKTIQVTSPLPGDGKSTIAGNLACSIAQSGKRVLAIDCDLRRPQLTDNFSLVDQAGLTNVLNGDCEPHDACHATPLGTLDVMPSGPIPANPAEALTLPEMSELLDLLRERYDYIIVDTPPLLVVTDPSITASMMDGVILALRIRRKSKPNARESLNILRSVGANILGTVINNSDEASASDGYRGYGYYRYGRYTSRYYYRRGGNRGGRGYYRKDKDKNRVLVSGRGAGQIREASTIEPTVGNDVSSKNGSDV